MPLIAGVDIGNFTTEAAVARIDGRRLEFLGSAWVETTGIKGTPQNSGGIQKALWAALDGSAFNLADIDVICLNEATPVIGSELGLDNPPLAEKIKIFPAAKVESPFHIRLEDDSLQFFDNPLSSDLLGKVVLLTDTGEMLPLSKSVSLKQLVTVRRDAKKKVFIPNVMRVLKRIAPDGNIRLMDRVVLLGGSALDYEIPTMISGMVLKDYGVLAGRGNIRGTLGPRNAVATGLILSYHKKMSNRNDDD